MTVYSSTDIKSHASFLHSQEEQIIVNNEYRYVDDLLALGALSGPVHSSAPVIEGFLPKESWWPVLGSHPDQHFVSFLRRAISHGFRIGVNPVAKVSTYAMASFHQQDRTPTSSPAILHRRWPLAISSQHPPAAARSTAVQLRLSANCISLAGFG